MWQYRLFDLDPSSDVDDALERYAKAGWHTWAAGRGALVVVNGVRVHRVSLRRIRRLGESTRSPLAGEGGIPPPT